MKYYLLILSFVFLISGCVVRTFPVTRDRVDQDLNMGNRGYLKGQVPSMEAQERKATRTTQVVEIELHSPIKFERMSKAKKVKEAAVEKHEDEALWGNRGFITENIIPEESKTAAGPSFEKYVVQKGDTLQKISKKFYGTTKKWVKIYEANKDTLSGPNKIYPRQVINIPIEPLKETKENLK